MKRPSRRALLGYGLAGTALTGGGLAAWAQLQPRRGPLARTAITVEAVAIASLDPARPSLRRFGELTFRSGLVLRSEADGFGGLSGLWRSPDGREIVAVTDNAQWLTARLDAKDGRLAGMSEVVLAPVLGAGGEPLRDTAAYDTEALALADGLAFVSIERVHEVRSFAWDRDGPLARGEPIPVPDEISRLPANDSLEALAVAPPGSPLAGRLVAVAERARPGGSTPTRGWVLTGEAPFAFDVARSGDFDVTDMAFLPSGELLLLERRFFPWSGVACRMRRIAADALRPDATIDGPVIFEVDRSHAIDNMEGLAIHREPGSGETVLTLVSDDNFSPVQRTLLLEFTLQS